MTVGRLAVLAIIFDPCTCTYKEDAQKPQTQKPKFQSVVVIMIAEFPVRPSHLASGC